MLLAKQHFMSGRSSSANGGWLAYLEQLVTGGLPALQRVDAFTFWEKDPVRVAVKEITEMRAAASSDSFDLRPPTPSLGSTESHASLAAGTWASPKNRWRRWRGRTACAARAI